MFTFAILGLVIISIIWLAWKLNFIAGNKILIV